jgi:RNA polymerase sigma-70 factor, ECF subfamily
VDLTEIYQRYHRHVRAYAASRVGHGLAEDVVGQTFLVATEKAEKVPSDPLPWLLGVARNVLRERYREELRQRALAEQLQSWVDEIEHDVADGVVQKAAALRALADLADTDRELLTLVAWHGLTARQAAKVLGCTTATFFVRLHRARRRFELALDSPRRSADEPRYEAAR